MGAAGPHRYRVIDESGTDLGPLVSKRSRTEWMPGESLSRTSGEELRIVAVVTAERHESFGAYLIVRPTD